VPTLCHALTSVCPPKPCADPSLPGPFRTLVQMTSAGVRSTVTESASKPTLELPSTIPLRREAAQRRAQNDLGLNSPFTSNRSVTDPSVAANSSRRRKSRHPVSPHASLRSFRARPAPSTTDDRLRARRQGGSHGAHIFAGNPGGRPIALRGSLVVRHSISATDSRRRAAYPHKINAAVPAPHRAFPNRPRRR